MEIIRNHDNFEEQGVLKEKPREEAKVLFEQYDKCAAGRLVAEFDFSYLLKLLYPEEFKLLNLSNLTLGSGAGEEEPPRLGNGAGKGGRRSRKQKKRRHRISRKN